MTVDPEQARHDLVAAGRSLFERGYAHGGAGNLSVRADDGGLLVTPTGSSLGSLDPARLSLVDADGHAVAGDPPTKELLVHRAVYARRPTARAVVHLHAPHSTAVSCLDGLDPTDTMPPLTAYHVMRVGRLPLVEFVPPGDPRLAAEVGALAVEHHAILLANHGSVAVGPDLPAAMAVAEEIEQTARLVLLLGDRRARPLTVDQVTALREP